MRRGCLHFIIASVGLIFVTPAVAKDSDLEQRLKLAEEIVKISQADKMSEQLSAGLIDTQKQALDLILNDTKYSDRQREEIIERVAEIIVEELDPAIAELTKKTTPLLAEVYTREELDDILAFYNSAAGRAMIAKQGILVEKSLAIGQEWNSKNLPMAYKRMQTRIDKVIEEAGEGI